MLDVVSDRRFATNINHLTSLGSRRAMVLRKSRRYDHFMQTRTLGTTDLNVTNLCLGTMQFGWTADEAASFAVLDAYVAAGGNFIRKGDIYSRRGAGNGGGGAEGVIGGGVEGGGHRV